MAETVTRTHLVDAVVAEVGLSRAESVALVEEVLETVSAAVASGETVKISSFGTFSVRQKSRRIGRNPKTGVEKEIEPRRVLVFRASQILKERMNGGDGVGVDD